jgi:hypothetical protein
MRGPAHRCRRILVDDLADDEPIEQSADRRKVLLDRRRAVVASQQFDVGGDVMGADRAELGHALHLEPGKEAAHGNAIGGPSVQVADMRGEEIDESGGDALAGGCD